MIDEITRDRDGAAPGRPARDGSALRADAAAVGRGASGRRPSAVLALGFDETFLRMWHFYLEYCRAGFASGYLDVHQLTLGEALSRVIGTILLRQRHAAAGLLAEG